MFNQNKKFSKVAKTWLLLKRFSIKKSTFYKYKYIVDKYILIYFKDKRILFFTNYDFNNYIQELSKTLSNNTINTVLIVFKSLLKYIEKKYNVDFKLDLICTPKKDKKEIKILNAEEILTLENYCSLYTEYKTIGIYFSLLTGMRLGEICALKWNDIDLKNGLVSVNKTLQRVYLEKGKTQIVIDKPKSECSIRKIPIPKKLLNILKNIYHTKSFTGDEFILTGKVDKYVEPRTLERTFEKCLKTCKIQHFKFHALRHTYATNCIRIGMDPKSLSILLGHANINITLEKYVHPSSVEQRKYVDLL